MLDVGVGRGTTVVLIVIGLVILAAGVHYVRRHRTPRDVEWLSGRVVDVAMRRSSIPGNPTRHYGATVVYGDPRTGEHRRLPPASFQPRAYKVGEVVRLAHSPDSGETRLPLPRPRVQMALPFAFGAAVIALGVLDLTS